MSKRLAMRMAAANLEHYESTESARLAYGHELRDAIAATGPTSETTGLR